MKYSLGTSNFLEEISSLSHAIIFLYFFALITEECFLLSLKGSAVSSSRFGSVYERGGKNTQKNYTKKIFTTQIIAKV